MFTGIIQHLGQVTQITKRSQGLKLVVNIGPLAKEINPSDSLAINGTCLTVTAKSGKGVTFDVASETLQRTNLGELKKGVRVNIERAIRAGEPFGGHFVSGHIDGVGTITRRVPRGTECLLEVSVPDKLSALMIEKGSVAVDGISLTLVAVKKDRFSVALIPYTMAHTTLGFKGKGDKVNIELDLIGKWVSKLLARPAKSTITPEFLNETGFS